MLKIGLIVFVIVTIIAGSGIGIGLRNKKRNEREEAIKEEFNLTLINYFSTVFFSAKFHLSCGQDYLMVRLKLSSL